MKIRVAINGFGRIGRQVAKLILTNKPGNLELVAVNTLEKIETCAFLLKYDSTQGILPANVQSERTFLFVDDNPPISFLTYPDPSSLPWKSLDIDLVVECSGNCSDKNTATMHLKAGAKKVLITAATSNCDITLCHGVNNCEYDPVFHNLISASSCTTNCVAPVAKVIDAAFGIDSGMATFLHSYTSSQPVLDSFGEDPRRSRSAALNIIPTTTSAEHQLPIILPQLKGRFKAIAIRIPTSIVHLADFTIKLKRNASKGALQNALESAANQEMKGIIAISHVPLVSVDYKKSSYSSVVDFEASKSYNDLVKLLIWHDNEFSYSSRVVDLISFISKPK